MIEFLLCWIIVLLALILVQFQSLNTQKRAEDSKEKLGRTIGVIVSSFLMTLICYGAIRLVNICILHLPNI